MDLQYILGVIGVLFVIGYLWQKRATPDSAAPPPDDNLFAAPPPSTSASASASAPASPSENMQQVIDRLIAEPSYRVSAEHADCRILIARGVDALLAMNDTVQRSADTWVNLYTSMGVVADGLGKSGRDTITRLLAEATDAHQSRIVSFLVYAASKMSPALCESLCEKVTPVYAESFGDAAAHHGKHAVEIIESRLLTAAPPQAEALQKLLCATFSSSNLGDKKLWTRALSDRQARVRAAAVAADSWREDRQAVLALADDADELVRYALVCHEDEVPNAALLRLAADASTRVRAAAVWKLDGDEAENASTFQRLLHDPQPAVALMAAISLEHPSSEERIQKALDSADAELRQFGARAAGFMSDERYVIALAQLEKAGHYDELAEAIDTASDEPAVLRKLVELALRNPPLQVLRAAEIQLAYTEVEGAAEIIAPLLSVSAPARVRRAGFYSIAPHRAAWPRHVMPLLRPDEPLLGDLINELESALFGDQPIDRQMFESLQKSYPRTPIEALAREALKKSESS